MKNPQKIKRAQRVRRHRKVRAQIKSTSQVPRLSVYRSLSHIQVQIIDDVQGKTLVSSSDKILAEKPKSSDKMTAKVVIAFAVGKDLASKAKQSGIEKVVFDRGGYKYHGRVKALAEGAREGGLKF